MNKLASVALFLATMAGASCAPIDDLSSPDPATRDAAAKILRATYAPPPRAKWEPLLASLKVGMTLPAFAEQLARRHIPFELFNFTRGGSAAISQLDDGWSLSSGFDDRNRPPVLTRVTLNWLGRYDAGVCTDENYYYHSGRIKTRTLHTSKSDYITDYRENGSIASTATELNNGRASSEPFPFSFP